MSTISEITLFAGASSYRFSQGPREWTACDGKMKLERDSSALHDLLKTTYGKGSGYGEYRVPKLSTKTLGKDYDLDKKVRFIMNVMGTYPSSSSLSMYGDVGTIKMFAGSSNHLPKGWVYCDGQELSVSSHQDLFNAIGNKYGGDGTTNFVLPKLNSASLHPDGGKTPKFVIATSTMGEEYEREGLISQVVLFAGETPPAKWAFCDGQTQNIMDNTAFFSLVGTNYGGDGRTIFGVPDLDASSISEGVAPKFIIATEGMFPTPE